MRQPPFSTAISSNPSHGHALTSPPLSLHAPCRGAKAPAAPVASGSFGLTRTTGANSFLWLLVHFGQKYCLCGNIQPALRRSHASFVCICLKLRCFACRSQLALTKNVKLRRLKNKQGPSSWMFSPGHVRKLLLDYRQTAKKQLVGSLNSHIGDNLCPENPTCLAGHFLKLFVPLLCCLLLMFASQEGPKNIANPPAQ